jgi:hypothetical protein
MTAIFDARRVWWAPLRVDGRLKMASRRLVRDIARCPMTEPGVEFERALSRR